ncbi:hypothetical protein MLD52_21760 [Puniceicoccaceae bacterium K14]|nr:hypothetical protein [Puniceicoccaceae bacterium K14]
MQALRNGHFGENDASCVMVYLAQAGGAKVNTDVIAGKQLKAWWYDPTTGQTHFIEETDDEGMYSP